MPAHRDAPPGFTPASQGWHLRFVRPPYAKLDDLEAGEREADGVGPGTLAILRLDVSDPGVNLDLVRHALRKSGICPLILEIRIFAPLSPSTMLDGAAFLDLARRAGQRGVRLVALSPLDRRELRERLTSTVGLIGAVRQWVQRSHSHLGEDEVALVVRYLAEGANDEDAAGVRLIPERTARGILSRSDLPPPVRLRAIGRLLRPVLRLQEDPGLPSARPLRIAIRRTLGVGVSEVREAWGPEKLLDLGFRQGRGSGSGKK